MPIRGSPNGAAHSCPRFSTAWQLLDTIARNRWTPSLGIAVDAINQYGWTCTRERLCTVPGQPQSGCRGSSSARIGLRLPTVMKHRSSQPGTSTLQVAQTGLPVGRKLNFCRPNFSAIRCPGSAGLW